MYPIIINRKPRKILYTKEIELNNEGVFTLSEISKLVKDDEKFSITEKDNSIYGSSYILCVSGQRSETEEEVNVRVKKEENYMKKYTEFHKLNKPNNNEKIN